jgi:8-amino-7-oxononanoate synthase
MSHEPPPTHADMRASLREELAHLTQQGRLRVRPVIDSPDGRVIQLRVAGGRRKLVNWASNDYLGLANFRPVKNAASRELRRYGAGSGAARLLAGGLAVHRRFEQRLAHWLGAADALLTTSGFQANLAAMVTLAGEPEDVIILDRACHASTYDGARLSAGTMLRFRHNDAEDLARQLQRTSGARRRIVCVESVYSMDGDEAPLLAIHQLCREHGALLVVDEAHALGVCGPGGRGLCAEVGIVPDLLIGTCSKSFGAQGGFLVGDSDLIELAVNRGRSFIYSTAPVPAAVGAALGALEQMQAHPQWPAELCATAVALRAALRGAGWQVPAGRTPIIPLIVGSEAAALALAAALSERGHHAPAIRPPTVPEGGCRLRLTLTRAHTAADCRRLVVALQGLAATAGVPLSQGTSA